MMVELLARDTAMKVVQASDGMPLGRNCLHIIPPQADLALDGGVLRLSQPAQQRGGRIDFFLNSLAQAYGERGVAIILSGTGSDGSVGVKAVSERGGLVIAQDPEEAAYAGMPRSAIATGAVNLILPAAKIPRALISYAQHPYVTARRKTVLPAEEAEKSLDELIGLLRAGTSRDFAHYKRATLLRRTQRRMAAGGVKEIADYVKLLRGDGRELELLSKDLLIHVTGFFRDPDAFSALARTVVRELLRQHRDEQLLRVWVPGCSTGEEAYSIAMLFLEEFAEAKRRVKLQVFASDVSEDAVAYGRNGLYPESIKADVPEYRLERFFVHEAGGYRVSRDLRDSIVFTVQDLLADPPFSHLDLVSCRNLLIYLQPSEQEKVLTLFHFALREGGFLMLGSSETVGKLTDHFAPVSEALRIFRRIGPVQPRGRAVAPLIIDRGRALWPRPAVLVEAKQPNLADLVRDQLLDTYAPAAVVINRKYQGLYFFGPTDRYLRVAPGEPSQDLPSMLRNGLASKFRAAARQASQNRAVATISGGQVKRNGDTVTISISVRPVQHQGEELFLVTFADEARLRGGPVTESPAEISRTEQLEQELETTRRELEATIRDLQASNQELTSLNEEAVSLNEEFQSTNEELESSREELQSLNEELTTVNSQLQEALDRERKMSDDLKNILNSSDVATLFLDRDLNIRYFTPAAAPLFNLIPTDIGRPLTDLMNRFFDIDLPVDARSVLASLKPVTREMKGMSGEWYLTTLSPYRTQENRVEGVVIAFVDITTRRVAEDALAEELDAMKRLHELTHQALRSARLETFLDKALEATIALHGADLGNIQLYDPIHKTLRIVAQRGFEQRFLDFFSEVDAHTGSVCGAAFAAGKRVVVEDIEADPSFLPIREEARAAGYRAVQSTPLLSASGEPLGMLSTHFRKPQTLPERVLRLTDIYALHAADAIEAEALGRNLSRQKAFAEAIINTIHEPLVVLDGELKVVSASNSFYRFFDTNAGETLGRSLPDTNLHHLDTPAFRELLDRVKSGEETVANYEATVDLEPLGGRVLAVTTEPIHDAELNGKRILVSFSDITAFKQSVEQLVAAKRSAEQANREKSRFLAAASHDLRQPLQTLKLLHGALEQQVKDEQTRATLVRMGGSLETMAGMLAALLDINQLEAGTLHPRWSDVPVEDLLRSLDSAFSEQAKEKGLGWRLVQCALTVRSDRRLLEEIVRNLLSNAIRYTDKGKVLLGCRRRGGSLRIEVWDTGIGIAREQLSQIFKEHHQTAESTQRGGLGLGLSIVQRLSDLLGHRIDVRSRLDAGSVFSVEVPLAQVMPPAQPAADEAQRAGLAPTGIILVVEDDASLREALEARLRVEGHRVVPATNGQAALDLLSRQGIRPDLVISDYNLPGRFDGVELAEALRSALLWRVPVIILSGDVRAEKQREIREKGLFGIVKPVKAAVLSKLIGQLLAGTPQPAETRAPVSAAQHLPAASPATIFVVDDNRDLRDAMRIVLSQAGYQVQTSVDAPSFLKSFRPEETGCLVVDVRMPGMSGLEMLARLASMDSKLPAIVITGQGDIAMAVEAMRAGAFDFIEKPVDPASLLASIDRALRQTATPGERSAAQAAAAMRIASLTRREREVMDLVVAGHLNKEIAARLGINQRTVETHRAAVMKRMEASSISELVRQDILARGA
jgi:two-component system CheB/CheR fusion protein